MNEALERMLDIVHSHEREQRAAILARAREDSKRIVGEAHRQARTRVSEYVLELKRHMRREFARAQAALETQRRRQRLRTDLALLEAGWTQLYDELIRRWSDPAGRAAWVEMVVSQALTLLPARRWEIVHPERWRRAEREALAGRLERELGHTPAFVACADIRAGVRIRVDGASVDGTLEGLLRDRVAIEAWLLAEVAQS
ncbi:MAG TPA: hypothetical protein PL143_06860 [Rhodocyclaceae bacterium]|nr:hypothetical protein [Rhodocyclaceae bacterium]